MKILSSGLGLVYKQEALSGTVNGTNTVFTTSLKPWDTTGNELQVWLGSIQILGTDWTFAIVGGVGQITFTTAPALGQTPGARYLTLN